ncbi:MAG: hypothetical protein EYC70_15290 [Planctomycetota bacterium]|nr:MAG: hypothetical protein EYC70_15290 [Planctomycetota bacterium]
MLTAPLVLLLVCALPRPELQTPVSPRPTGPAVAEGAVATFVDGPVRLTGTSFGSAGPGRALLIRDGTGVRTLPSTAPEVKSWTDREIRFRLPSGTGSGGVRVQTPAGLSDEAALDVYRYDWFDIPPTPGTNASPLAVAVGADGRVWVNQEFHLEFQMLDPAVGAVQGLQIPKPPDPGPFATTIFGDHRTQMSTLGEDIFVDPDGRVWFSQGGGYLYQGLWPNHSRIVCFDPAAPPGFEFRVYNLPGDWNEVIGLAWDEVRERIWFTEGGLVSGAKIGTFDPERVPWDNHFDFSTSLDHLLCPPGGSWDDCICIYLLPNPTAQPAHLLVDRDGFVWYTAYWGNAIGRLDPVTGVVTEYPLPPHIGKAPPAFIAGSGPWQILQAPGGDIVFNEFFDSTIARFDILRLGDPACLQLDAEGRNPCIEERVIPEADLRDEQLHSIAYDTLGNLWYTIHTADEPDLRATLGYLTPSGDAVRLPPMSRFPGAGAPSFAGVAVDLHTGAIWFAEFWRKRLGRLERLPG